MPLECVPFLCLGWRRWVTSFSSQCAPSNMALLNVFSDFHCFQGADNFLASPCALCSHLLTYRKWCLADPLLNSGVCDLAFIFCSTSTGLWDKDKPRYNTLETTHTDTAGPFFDHWASVLGYQGLSCSCLDLHRNLVTRWFKFGDVIKTSSRQQRWWLEDDWKLNLELFHIYMLLYIISTMYV